MLNLLKPAPALAPGDSLAVAIINELAKENGGRMWYPFELKSINAGIKFLDAAPQTQCEVVLAMIDWFHSNPPPKHHRFKDQNWKQQWKMRDALFQMLKHKLPFSEEQLVKIFDWSAKQEHNYYRGVPHMIRVLTNFAKKNEITSDVKKAIHKLIRAIETEQVNVEARRWMLRLKELSGDTDVSIPLTRGDVWADAALANLQSLDVSLQRTWAELLVDCLRATGSKPSRKWIKSTETYFKTIDQEDFKNLVLKWFHLVEQPRETPIDRHSNVLSLVPANADILKGLVWMCSRFEDAQMAYALMSLALTAYKKIPGVGPRSGKVGNACFWSLGNMPGMDGIAQLSILKLKIKTNNAQKAIASSLELAAKRTGTPEDEIEEMCVPAYGLQEVGYRHDELGDFHSEIRIVNGNVNQIWVRKDAKVLSSAPKTVKEQYPEEIKDIAQAVKDIRKMLPALKDRIDNLYLLEKRWAYQIWMARYIDHPLVGTVARRLIWKFDNEKQSATGIWSDNGFVDFDNNTINWLDETAGVQLWHPLDGETKVVLQWRRWLLEHEVQQPFKQAYREVYVLTDAERNTHVYSNRYAAHILRQHQFNALCAARGWKNLLRLMVDGDFPPARKELPHWGIRAEYWVDGIGDHYGADTNETGTFLYLSTDQVRFYRIDALENRSHAFGGGYTARRWNNRAEAEPIPLEEIPPLVFSEIMRDVDMFVGVTSLGNDPTWVDSGRDVRYRDYWHGYSFGDLTESAKTRKQVLETLVPRLKIAQRCELTDKFLVVRGDVRTYKIHLGSGNILMEPNDEYLCIVPSRGGKNGGTDKLFVPFEGDQTLAIILSKAFLLAGDKKITDPTITRQLKR